MKRLLFVFILLLFVSPVLATDYSDGRIIYYEDFIRDFNVVTLLTCDSLIEDLVQIYSHDHFEIIDGKLTIKTFSITIDEIGEPYND